MKRLPENRRDYYDETLVYCLDDGAHLVEGPGGPDERATAILPGRGAAVNGVRSGEAPAPVQPLKAASKRASLAGISA